MHREMHFHLLRRDIWLNVMLVFNNLYMLSKPFLK